MPFGGFFGLISAFIPSETKSLGEQTHLKSLLGPDFLHLLSLILPSSVYVYLWHQLTKTNPPPSRPSLGCGEKKEKRNSAAFCAPPAWKPDARRRNSEDARKQVSLCLTEYSADARSVSP